VNNFDDPYQPQAVQLPAGQGHQLQQDVKTPIEHIRREIPKAFESEEYGSRRDEIGKALDQQRSRVLERMGERAAQAQLHDLDRQEALYLVGGLIEDLTEKYRELPAIVSYLNAVEQDVLEHLELFQPQAAGPAAPTPPGAPMPTPWAQELPFRKYAVNVLVDHRKDTGAPVVIELNPSYANLFGRIEK
jgi:hypothetical protein